MLRRSFLKSSLTTAGALYLPNFLKGSTMGTGSFGANRLIVVQLSGGNDGLNTVVPFRNDDYYRARPKIALSSNQVLQFTDDLGLNPALKPLLNLYDNGDLSIVNNVGYPNPNRSHFRSMDIWQTASEANRTENTGWLGRYLDSECPSDNSRFALEVDDSLSLAMKGSINKALVFRNVAQMHGSYQKMGLRPEQVPDDPGNASLDFLHSTYADAHSSAKYLFEKSRYKSSHRIYPKHAIGKHLKTISELIRGGCDTRVYYTSISGFDTHVNQRDRQNTLLKAYSESISSLIQDLKEVDQWRNTLILTFSEFGRRVKENASAGTDHGAANNVFLMGGSLKNQGVHGGSIDLNNLDNGDVRFNIDFRSIYAEILDQWMGTDSTEIIGRSFKSHSVI